MVEAEASALLLVLVNAPPAEASTLAKALVTRRLAACVNVIPRVQSFYEWEGKLCDEEESTLFIKTTRERLDALTEAVKEVHSYSVPEVLPIPVAAGGNDDYREWLRSMVRA